MLLVGHTTTRSSGRAVISSGLGSDTAVPGVLPFHDLLL
jgi:hypothetical protein